MNEMTVREHYREIHSGQHVEFYLEHRRTKHKHTETVTLFANSLMQIYDQLRRLYGSDAARFAVKKVSYAE